MNEIHCVVERIPGLNGGGDEEVSESKRSGLPAIPGRGRDRFQVADTRREKKPKVRLYGRSACCGGATYS